MPLLMLFCLLEMHFHTHLNLSSFFFKSSLIPSSNMKFLLHSLHTLVCRGLFPHHYTVGYCREYISHLGGRLDNAPRRYPGSNLPDLGMLPYIAKWSMALTAA